MKSFLKYSIITTALLLSISSRAQQTVSSAAFHISFETSELLENYDTGEDYILGYDNAYYAVDIAMIPYANETSLFLRDIQKGAWELAEDLGFAKIEDGGTLPYIEDAYYVKAVEFDTDAKMIVTTYVVAILYPELKMAYEATVYCYTTDTAEGESIVKSFRLIKPE